VNGTAETLLEVEDLRVHFDTDDGLVRAVDGISYSADAGRTIGIVGESGSGKTVGAMTLLGLTRAPNASISGSVRFRGRDLLELDDEGLRAVRGNEIAMVFQDPLSALHPFYKVGWQLVEAVQAHQDVGKSRARARAIELLCEVGIPEPAKRIDDYPHEFSGGMRQRAMIAMALVNEPSLLIADEPTTALDVTTQAQILALLARLQSEHRMAVILITHDLGVVAENADDVAVMYAGKIVEQAGARELFAAPQHPYTWGLLRSIPSLTDAAGAALHPIAGLPPSLIHVPPGCSFHPRCPYAKPRHAEVEPDLEPVDGAGGHRVACLLSAERRAAIWEELRG
jgi:peptide/nickel transport system ATP-binding protein